MLPAEADSRLRQTESQAREFKPSTKSKFTRRDGITVQALQRRISIEKCECPLELGLVGVKHICRAVSEKS